MTSFPDLAAAEHWIHALDPVPAVAGTVFALGRAAVVLASEQGARAVRFAGVDELAGTLTVAEVLARSAITRVEVLGGTAAPAEAILDTLGFVRPVWRDDELVLTATPAAGDVLVPFETRNPTPCCAGH